MADDPARGVAIPMQFRSTIEALNDAGVRYVVVGGVAVVLHSYLRMTRDLDLMVDLDPAEARKAIEALTATGLRPRVPVDPTDFADPEVRRSWRDERNMLVFTMIDPDDPWHDVDVFIHDPIPFEDVWERSLVGDLGDVAVRYASIEDLIALKEGTGRSKDTDDIENLKRIRRILDQQDPDGGGR